MKDRVNVGCLSLSCTFDYVCFDAKVKRFLVFKIEFSSVFNISCFFFCLSSYTEAEGENDQKFTVFSYGELRVATHGFSASNKIGEGAFGSVYKVTSLT